MIVTIAIGVALGIFIAAGLFYSANRWGGEALHRSTRAGEWVWTRKLRISLVAGAIAALPIAVVLIDYGVVLLNEFAHSTAGKYEHVQYDGGFDIIAEIRGTRWENNPMLFVTARNREHLQAIATDHDWMTAHRERLCKSPWKDWRPAMVIMGPECAQAAARRNYDERWRNRSSSPMLPTFRYED